MPRSPRRPLGAVLLAASAAAAIGLAVSGTAGGEEAEKSTLHIYKDRFSVKVGHAAAGKSRCFPGQRAVGGGYQVAEGNIVHIIGAYTTGDDKAYQVNAIVPAPFQTTGALPAVVRIKVICAETGKPIVP